MRISKWLQPSTFLLCIFQILQCTLSPELIAIFIQGAYNACTLAPFRVYDDVVAALKAFAASDREVYVYSSGSVEAQKLLFGYSEKGDLQEVIRFITLRKGGGLDACGFIVVPLVLIYFQNNLLVARSLLSIHISNVECCDEIMNNLSI